MLGAALLAGSAVASVELRRGTRSRTAAARAESEVRRGLGAILQKWQPALDSLPIGRRVELTVPARGDAEWDIAVQGAVRRVTARLYAATAAVAVGRDDVVLARRRALLFLERPVETDSSAATVAVAPVRGWSVLDLH
jgi:hypothetical protein